MARLVALGSLLLLVPVLIASDPPPVERQLAIQKAMLAARQYLDVNMPADAVAALEAHIANADGNRAFLSLLREAYLAELDASGEGPHGRPVPHRPAQAASRAARVLP